MRAVIQRVKEAEVVIRGCDDIATYQTMGTGKKRRIGAGFLVLLGVCEEDNMEDVEWLVKKIANLRVFDDDQHVMNRSIQDISGEVLIVIPNPQSPI